MYQTTQTVHSRYLFIHKCGTVSSSRILLVYLGAEVHRFALNEDPQRVKLSELDIEDNWALSKHIFSILPPMTSTKGRMILMEHQR